MASLGLWGSINEKRAPGDGGVSYSYSIRPATGVFIHSALSDLGVRMSAFGHKRTFEKPNSPLTNVRFSPNRTFSFAMERSEIGHFETLAYYLARM